MKHGIIMEVKIIMDLDMQYVVSVTSQGQLTIPMEIRKKLGLMDKAKAIISQEGDTLIVKPKDSFWSIAGSLASDITLTDEELKNARASFSKDWAEL